MRARITIEFQLPPDQRPKTRAEVEVTEKGVIKAFPIKGATGKLQLFDDVGKELDWKQWD